MIDQEQLEADAVLEALTEYVPDNICDTNLIVHSSGDVHLPSLTFCDTPAFTFHGSNGLAVTLHDDGTVTHEGTPDEAARAFWEAVTAAWPGFGFGKVP